MKTTVTRSSAMLVIMLAMLLIANDAKSQNLNEAYQSYIEVTGYAEKEVAPDRFYMHIVINEQDSKGRKSVEDQQRTMLKALKNIGIDTEKQLTRLSLSSSYYNKRTNLSMATYQLKLNAAEDVSRVWQALDALGISDVSFQKAEYSGIDALKADVCQEAVRNAQKQATSMAEAIGQKVGKCFYMYGGYSGNPVVYAQPRLTKAMSVNMMEDSIIGEESIEFNTIKVSTSVSTKFVLE